VVIGISLLYTGILSGLYAVVEKRYEGYVQALLSSPIRAYQFLLSEIVAVLAGALISIATIVVVGLALGAPLHEIPSHRLLVSLTLMVVSVLGLIGLGMVLAVLTKTPQVAGALGNAIAFPVMFLGGFTIPKWVLPSWLQVFPEVIPHSKTHILHDILHPWGMEFRGDASLRTPSHNVELNTTTTRSSHLQEGTGEDPREPMKLFKQLIPQP